MVLELIVKKNQYYDSVFLMGVNKRLSEAEGVRQSAVVMASETNKRALVELGITDPRLDAAGPNDLVVAVLADTREVASRVVEQFDQFLNASTDKKSRTHLRTLQDGLEARPDANLAVISVPGEYAAREARQAVERGLHVFLFSDNVSLEDEISLKKLAGERGVLVKGPDCGTSIIGGVGLGFANRVRRGPIGVVGPAGTGLQEFTCLVHHLGGGISHAIGTGSRDLSDAVGGVTTLAGLQALENDPQTEVVAVVSKPPGRKTLDLLLDFIARCRKPVVACFLGVPEKLPGSGQAFRQARTIDEAASLAIGKQLETLAPATGAEWLERFKKRRGPEQRFVRGIFAGGTFCYQSQQILREGGLPVYSNAPIDPLFKLEHPDRSREHSLVDMGEDFYTRGRPHPMIDSSQRARRIVREAEDPAVAVILLDFILGYNCSPDPVGELLPAIETARMTVEKRGATIAIVASLTGTELDPQDYSAQRLALEQAGVLTFPSNASAAEWCLRLLKD
jgi:succinyl-CoA synthetase alpha subunit